MATLALAAAGASIGGAVLPSIPILGTTISGAALGQAVGALAGSLIDEALFDSSGQSKPVEGPRLTDLQVTASSEGAPIPRVYGRARLAGQIIWATPIEEEVIQTSGESSSGGGKGGLSQPTSSGTGDTIEYRYYANIAIGLCKGKITRIGRVWGNGKELELSKFTYRVHRGSESQLPDSLIQSKVGIDAPAYRGLAYVVFEHMALEEFGNHLPQLQFEIFRAVDDFEQTVRAVNIIPAAGEFAYEKSEVTRDAGGGLTIAENVHTRQGGSDWVVAANQLQDDLPNVDRASLVVSWFGTDLRAGQCQLKPGVEISEKQTSPYLWSVGGLSRDQAYVVSKINDRPAYGGTPADASVVSAIQDLTARGIVVTFSPFILMDVPSGNSLPDPYGGAGQPEFPWRGRITVDPAPGVAGSPDKSAAAVSQIAAFVGTAQPTDFSVSGTTVTYGGPNEWSFRRLILHYALLCKAAGGVEGFLIGSEMRGLTWVRDSISSYPFVSALVQLAADVKSILGVQTKIAYAADWSEYFGHQPSDGSGDVHFHLDPLWSSPNIDAIGIDMYWPLSDWRDGAHLDRQSGAQSIHDLDYLKSNIRAGEGYDWYYASSADRDSQVRTPITDGLGKPWVFRFKNVWSWWQSQHFDRPGGVEVGAATAWTPQSKPIWFSETGCPAVDKGANQPNVFWDPKSSESFLPYYSRGVRDDLIQRRYVQALYEFFDPSHEDFVAGSNPNSVIYGGPMVDVTRIYVYAWDARPYPAFPFLQNVWTDGENWTFGHWLTGRVSGGPVSAVVRAILDDYGFNEGSSFGLTGVLDGYVIDRIMSARQALQPLELAYFFDSVETGGQILFRQRGMGGVERTITQDQLVEVEPGGKLYQVVRGQETELPNATKVTFIQGNQDYRQGAVESRRLAGGSARVSSANLPIVMGEAQALGIAEVWLHDTWLARERTSFALPPSLLALEPGDLITLQTPTRSHSLRITGATVGQHTEIDSRSIDPDVFLEYPVSERQGKFTAPVVFGPTLFIFLDLPIIRGNEAPHNGYAVAYQSPWPGGAAFFRSPSDVGFQLKAVAAVPGTFGVTTTDLFSGPTWRYDRANALTVVLHGGALSSTTELGLLGGANMAAVQNGDGEWEVMQFLNATLVDTDTYELSVLLRGQAGSEYAMREPVGAGATIVLLDDSVVPVDMVPDEVGLAFNWRIGPVGRDIGHSSYSDAVYAFSGVGLRPLSPVHVQSEHQGTDLVISWMRRTRIAGDSWNTVDVPLGEDIEGYEIEILNGASVKRTLSVDQTTVTYSEADQIADWGTPQASYQVRVFQMSATRGRGFPRSATV